MTIELIQAMVRQTTVLIAQIATSKGWRAPLAHLADQVFQDLVAELERQGVSRKVSADMFGMGLRSYQRRVQRLAESTLEPGRSLWEAVLDHIRLRGIAPKAEVLRAFANEDDVLLRGVLRDLCDSQLVFQAGQGAQTVYRAVSEDELGALRAFRAGDGLDELVWAIVYREGPVSREQLIHVHHIDPGDLDGVLWLVFAALIWRSRRVPLASPNRKAGRLVPTLRAPPATWSARRTAIAGSWEKTSGVGTVPAASKTPSRRPRPARRLCLKATAS